jgi:hypothetical protein
VSQIHNVSIPILIWLSDKKSIGQASIILSIVTPEQTL